MTHNASNPAKQRREQIRSRVAAIVVSVALLLSVVVLSVPQSQTSATNAFKRSRPDQCVAALVAAEMDGDVGGYLDCFAGDLRKKLQRRAAATPTQQLASELRQRTADLAGHATTTVRFPTETMASLILERIYTGYNERQYVRLRFGTDGWKIVDLTPIERFVPEIPYGTPVVASGGDREHDP